MLIISMRSLLCLLLGLLAAAVTAHADDALFFGNSFTFGATVKPIQANGGVPAMVSAIATARGHQLTSKMIAAGGKNFAYLLALPETTTEFAKTWQYVTLQDYSNRATQVGDPKAFLSEGLEFGRRIATNSPKATIILYETWPPPAGSYYGKGVGTVFARPDAMMAQIHDNYGQLRDALAAQAPGRDVRVALVGTAWQRALAENPGLNLYALDRHHGNVMGYYLAALVIEETMFHESVQGAPATFFNGTVVVPPDDVAKLQAVADEVAGGK
jgi:hypothetical protein